MNARRQPDVGTAACTAIVRQDHLRLPRPAADGCGFKEWHHFSVSTDEVDALVNFAVLDVAPPGSSAPRWAPRVTVLARSTTWRGGVDRPDPARCELNPGAVHARMGAHAFFFADGAYRVTARSGCSDVEVDLVLAPETLPAIVHNVDVAGGRPLHWLMVPRLRASGTVRVDGCAHEVRGQPAYHDHNWGRFGWRGGFAWEWGYVLAPPGGPDWAIVFVRMRDGAQHRTLRQGVFVWRGGLQRRVFRGASVAFERSGACGTAPELRVPPVLALAHPEGRTDVPAKLALEAREGDDLVQVAFDSEGTAQVLVPHDGERGATRIQEVAGRARVKGRVGGVEVDFEARTVVEFLRG